MGDVSVKVLDSEGNVVERWTLRNSFIAGVAYSELSYANEGINTITLTLSYDYADLDIFEVNQNNTIA